MSEDEHITWCSLPDHYVVHGADPKHSLGMQPHEDLLETERRFIQFHEPLRGLELFAGLCISLVYMEGYLPEMSLGAGGFGTGLGQSGHIKTLWAIEWDEPAATTYRSV